MLTDASDDNEAQLRIARAARLLAMNQCAEALEDFSRACDLEPTATRAQLGRGQALTALGRAKEAIALFHELEYAMPAEAALFAARAQAWLRLDRVPEAEADAERALAIDGAAADAHVSMGFVRLASRDVPGALASFETACCLSPDIGTAHAGRGYALERLGHTEKALAAHGRAVALGWCDAQALLAVGTLLVQLNRFDNALAAFAESLRLQPKSWRAQEGVAMTLIGLRRYEEAVPALEALVRTAPWIDDLAGHILHARLHCCDWRGYDATTAEIATRVRRGERVDTPFSFLAHNASQEDQLNCARSYARQYEPGIRRPAPSIRPATRIRIAYLSADFHQHATAYLAAGLFESHDRSRFETTAISYGPHRDDTMRARLRPAFDRFVDVAEDADARIAERMAELEIDIAVDMKGYTTGGRPGILAHRAAPLQVAFLAFPGTMGAPFVDYLVADKHVIPHGDEAFYQEKIIWMPVSYQVNDRIRAAAVQATRRDAGLDDAKFVFCCFNASYKISPHVFSVWMRILGAVPGSVLWLLEGPAAALRNLRTECARHQIDPARIVFAPPLPAAAHWGRIALADLFLDTLPCNAHTTASDAIWAGVPLVTVAGTAFAGRVATSLLHAVGVPELSVGSLGEYEQLAVHLARSPAELAALRTRLAAATERGPLFDPTAYCRSLEAAFVEIHSRRQRGEAPRSLDVSSLPNIGDSPCDP